MLWHRLHCPALCVYFWYHVICLELLKNFPIAYSKHLVEALVIGYLILELFWKSYILTLCMNCWYHYLWLKFLMKCLLSHSKKLVEDVIYWISRYLIVWQSFGVTAIFQNRFNLPCVLAKFLSCDCCSSISDNWWFHAP